MKESNLFVLVVGNGANFFVFPETFVDDLYRFNATTFLTGFGKLSSNLLCPPKPLNTTSLFVIFILSTSNTESFKIENYQHKKNYLQSRNLKKNNHTFPGVLEVALTNFEPRKPNELLLKRKYGESEVFMATTRSSYKTIYCKQFFPKNKKNVQH